MGHNSSSHLTERRVEYSKMKSFVTFLVLSVSSITAFPQNHILPSCVKNCVIGSLKVQHNELTSNMLEITNEGKSEDDLDTIKSDTSTTVAPVGDIEKNEVVENVAQDFNPSPSLFAAYGQGGFGYFGFHGGFSAYLPSPFYSGKSGNSFIRISVDDGRRAWQNFSTLV